MKIYTKFIILTFLFLGFMNISHAQMEFKDIVKSSDWESAITEAKESGKLIFLDIYATWCGPCKYLESTIYPDSALGKYYNSHFINLKMDGETEFGRLKAREFALTAYPSMYFLDSQELLLAKVVGVKQAPDLKNYGQKVVSNSAHLQEFNDAYLKDRLSVTELIKYNELLQKFDQKELAAEVEAKIVPSLSEENVFNPEYKSLIMGSKTDLDATVFIALKNNPEKVNMTFSPEEREKLFSSVFDASMNKAISEKDTLYFNRIITEFVPVFMQNDSSGMERGVYISQKLFYANTEEWEKFESLLNSEYQSKHKNDDKFLYMESLDIVNNYARMPEAAEIALSLMDVALDINSSFENLIMSAYLNGILTYNDVAKARLSKAASMNLNEDQKKIVQEIQDLLNKVENKTE